MPSNKKHHYVPKFCLKKFSENKKVINIWNIGSKMDIPNASLKDQCYKDYFYGKETQVEQALCTIEGHAAKIFSNIEKSECMPLPSSIDYRLLVLFMLAQLGRTNYYVDMLHENANKIFKNVYSDYARENGFSIEDYSINCEGLPRQSIANSMRSYPIIMDLKPVLIVNNTEEDFVISDNPIVLYNKLLSSQSIINGIGLGSKGLMIFFPLSPRYSILLYDQYVYSLTGLIGSKLPVSDLKSVYDLNKLQMVSAYNNVYYKSVGQNVKVLFRSAEKFRRDEKTHLGVHSFGSSSSTDKKVLLSSVVGVNINVKLNFCRITRSSRDRLRDLMHLKCKPAVLVRNASVLSYYNDFISDVNNRVDEEEVERYLEVLDYESLKRHDLNISDYKDYNLIC